MQVLLKAGMKMEEENYFKAGDYCEEYNDIYGNSHPEYGGTLVDLRSLPNGTNFYCENGQWQGFVYINSDGKKCVGAIGNTTDKDLVLTDKNNALYISKL